MAVMSDDLNDEVEAINSIFAPTDPTTDPQTLVPLSSTDSTFVLAPPPPSPDHPPCASLRVRFPASYPTTDPPVIEATHSSAEHGRKGDAARHLALFRRAVETVFRPGEVCLYEAIEEFGRLLEEEDKAEKEGCYHNLAHQDGSQEDGGVEEGVSGQPRAQTDSDILDSPPPWALSEPITELKSTFIARVAPVRSPAQATSYVRHLLATDKRVRQATHNMTAWRIRGAPGTGATFQDCDDDGETAAGSRLLRLMQLMDLWDVMVVVSRWYGGHKLGPKRFALINSAARDGFVRAGFAAEGEKSGKKKK